MKVSEIDAKQIINYRGFAATRAQAYKHAFAATKNHLSAERMAYGFSVPVLTREQIARYLPFETMIAWEN
jgi:hypothetical protein